MARWVFFEQEAFAAGTRVLAGAIAESASFSLAGGGDTLAAIDQFGVSRITYRISRQVAARF